MDGDADQSSSLWTDEAVPQNLFLTSEAAKLNPTSKIAFHAPVTSSVNKSSKIVLTEDPSG